MKDFATFAWVGSFLNLSLSLNNALMFTNIFKLHLSMRYLKNNLLRTTILTPWLYDTDTQIAYAYTKSYLNDKVCTHGISLAQPTADINYLYWSLKRKLFVLFSCSKLNKQKNIICVKWDNSIPHMLFFRRYKQCIKCKCLYILRHTRIAFWINIYIYTFYL